MQVEPLKNVTESSLRKVPVNDAALYFHRDLEIPVYRMEMRRRMLPREDADHNPKESR